MTVERAGEICGLIRAGEMGMFLMCCIMIAVGFFPRNGSMPVQIS